MNVSKAKRIQSHKLDSGPLWDGVHSIVGCFGKRSRGEKDFLARRHCLSWGGKACAKRCFFHWSLKKARHESVLTSIPQCSSLGTPHSHSLLESSLILKAALSNIVCLFHLLLHQTHSSMSIIRFCRSGQKNALISYLPIPTIISLHCCFGTELNEVDMDLKLTKKGSKAQNHQR